MMFKKRKIEPATDNQNYLHTSGGGFNPCIKITNKSVLPNCVGYAWGRWREILGYNHKLSRNNAEDWFNFNDGYNRGQEPKIGAVICWKKGALHNYQDGAGHVAVVEEILPNGEIVVSNSDYNGRRFYLLNLKPPYFLGKGYEFMGFIYLPLEFEVKTEIKENVESNNKDELLELVRKTLRGDFGNGQARKNILGSQYEEVQRQVNLNIKNGNTKWDNVRIY